MGLLRRLAAALPGAAALCLLATSGATAAPAAPFGHACTPTAGALFCPTTTLDQRVPSFDGVPIDVDVTLPGTGDGPFPTLVLLHGYGGSKTDTEAADPGGDGKKDRVRNNNLYFAGQGYAVLSISARGFGRSCGRAESRTSPECDRGWIHLADTRYEARDTQELLGKLVDQGLVDPARIGVTGGSYGGGQSLELAYLKDRIRLPDGSYAPWRSPAGVPLRIAASAPVIPWSDIASALQPNGRYLDTQTYSAAREESPLGVSIGSYVNGLYVAGASAGFVAPPGVDPAADLSRWRDRTNQGEPEDAFARSIITELQTYHSGITVTGETPAPLLIANGWTDDLFPAAQALRVYETLKGQGVSLLFGDFGHARGTNKPSTLALGADARDAFFGQYLLGRSGALAPGSVEATLTSCNGDAPDAGPYRAASWTALHPGVLPMAVAAAQTIRSDGGDPALGKAFDPITNGDACKTTADEKPAGDAFLERRSPGVTLLGLTTITATVRSTGKYGEIAGRLWDVDPKAKTMRLVDRGVLRLKDAESGRLTWQLHGQGYRFAAGHTIRLELSASDADYFRKSNGTFTATVSGVQVRLPVHDRPSAKLGVAAP